MMRGESEDSEREKGETEQEPIAAAFLLEEEARTLFSPTTYTAEAREFSIYVCYGRVVSTKGKD